MPAFTFKLDEEILGEAREKMRREEAEMARLKAEEEARVRDAAKAADAAEAERLARQRAEEEKVQSQLKAEADARAAIEAERLAKDRAIADECTRKEAARVAREQAAEDAKRARLAAEAEVKRAAAAEQAAKQQALVSRLAKEAAMKTVRHTPAGQLASPTSNTTTPPSRKNSPWGGATELPANKPKSVTNKQSVTDIFKSTPPPVDESVAPDATMHAPKKSILGAAFTKPKDGSH